MLFSSQVRSLLWHGGLVGVGLGNFSNVVSRSLLCHECRTRCWNTRHIMARGVRVLNVAEKNDAAKSLADLMSRGRFRRVSITTDCTE